MSGNRCGRRLDESLIPTGISRWGILFIPLWDFLQPRETNCSWLDKQRLSAIFTLKCPHFTAKVEGTRKEVTAFPRTPPKAGRLNKKQKEVHMNIVAKVLTFAALLIMAAAPITATAAEKKVKSEVVMKTGKKVNLFHSGTADVKKEICPNDVITVYRETMGGGHTTIKEVGKVKVLGYLGEHYFDAEVVSGEIKVGDIAKKETASCLVQPAR